jgi:16S rRNA (uracil1498-N3)-methyltransferase
MQLFYDKNINPKEKQFIFDKTESKHIIRVLRKKEGDILHITNGNGFLFTSKIINANDKKCLVEIIKKEFKENKLKYNLHIAIAPTKNNQRLEWFLEKATEIGISEITPIICDNSERKVVKQDRLEKVLVSAMKQSNRFYLPKLNNVISFKEFVKQKKADNLFIAHCEEGTNKTSFKSELKDKNEITLLIGPEGDFSTTEIKEALQNNYQPVSLGNSRLRTETAAIVGVHSVAFYNEK